MCIARSKIKYNSENDIITLTLCSLLQVRSKERLSIRGNTSDLTELSVNQLEYQSMIFK